MYVPLQLGDSERSGAKILKSLMKVDFLNAQRYLADSSAAGRSEDLSKRLGRFYERNLEQCAESENFDAVMALANSEEQLNSHLAKVFEPTLARLNKLGYPGFFDPHLVIRSALNAETIMKQSAQVHYALGTPGEAAEQLSLPDKYNGLGFKNLIYMVIEVLDYHARWAEESEDRAPLHLVIIEEPEAHLHTQLQQVFIRRIMDILPKDDPASFTSQFVITTHSPHIIYESGFKPIRYFRRTGPAGAKQGTTVLNISEFYSKLKKDEGADTYKSDFLQRYMKLTHCDLFFADAAILVEGNVERLLMQQMIENVCPQLQSCCLSILEVGGAFAHMFRELLEFLGLPALIITDLDSVSPKAPAAVGAAEAVPAGDAETDEGKACLANEAGAVTSNQMLIKWLPKLTQISDLLDADEAVKIQKADKDTPATIRVTYQIAYEVSWSGEKLQLAGRTFEEAFAFENLDWCQNPDRKHLRLAIPSSAKLSASELVAKIHNRVKSGGFNKTGFALALLTEDPTAWKVPAYIEQGLRWLTVQMPWLAKQPTPAAVVAQPTPAAVAAAQPEPGAAVAVEKK
jgi:predicted ATP-dependent endonuclease of OLD family